MEAKKSKAQLEVWEQKEALHKELQPFPELDRLLNIPDHQQYYFFTFCTENFFHR